MNIFYLPYILLHNIIHNIIQIMTDHEGNRKIYLVRGIQEGLEIVARGLAEGNSQLFPGLTESREPDGVLCCPRDQSLYVLLYHYRYTMYAYCE